MRSCSILTTTPDAVTSPVPLNRDDYDLWLDPGTKDTAAVSTLLRPFDGRAMRCYPVSSQVNQVKNDDEGCCTPVALETPQGQFFA